MNSPCCICAETFRSADVVSSPCGYHISHKMCINIWLERIQKLICPVCQFGFASDNIRKVKAIDILATALKGAPFSSETKRKEISCYLENVKEEWKEKDNMVQLQKKYVEELQNINKRLTVEIDQLRAAHNENNINEPIMELPVTAPTKMQPLRLYTGSLLPRRSCNRNIPVNLGRFNRRTMEPNSEVNIPQSRN